MTTGWNERVLTDVRMIETKRTHHDATNSALFANSGVSGARVLVEIATRGNNATAVRSSVFKRKSITDGSRTTSRTTLKCLYNQILQGAKLSTLDYWVAGIGRQDIKSTTKINRYIYIYIYIRVRIYMYSSI